jgi:hypothetical protein
MTAIRVMAIFHGPGDLGPDRIINTWHFIGTADYDASATFARRSVDRFYNAPNNNHSIGEYLSPWVQRVGEMRSYNMDLPKDERSPTIETLTLGPASSGGLPEEVACCLSYHAIELPTNARRRGRVFIGPLGNNAIDSATSTTPARPIAAMLSDLAFAANRLLSEPEGGVPWALRSVTPAQNFHLIGGGYIDNAFDTQRRRGPDTTARVLWGT